MGPSILFLLRNKEWVQDAIFSDDRSVLTICLKEDNKYIGNVMLQEFDYINRPLVCQFKLEI